MERSATSTGVLSRIEQARIRGVLEGIIARLGRLGRSRSWSAWLAAVVLAAYLGMFLVGLVRSDYFGPFSTVDEQLMYFQVARTFNEYGFLNSVFLQDFSSSPSTAHHPFVYNHMPPGPEILTAVLMKVFGERYRAIRLCLAAMFVIGIVYYLRFVKILLARLELGGAGLVLLLLPQTLMLHSIDHPAYSGFPFIAFFPVVALDAYHRTGRRHHYWLALLVVLLGSLYLVYQQLLMLFASWILLGSLRILRLDRAEVLALLATGSLGVVLHLLQSVFLLGPPIWLEELRLTLSNRMFGVPSTRELHDFYQSIAVVHQGFHQFDWRLIREVLQRSLQPVGGWLAAYVVIGSMAGGLVLARVRASGPETMSALRVLPASVLWAALLIVFPLMVFPAYAASYQLAGANRFFLAAVVLLGLGYAVRECVRAVPRLASAEGLGSWRWGISLGVLTLLLIGFVAFGLELRKAQRREFTRSVRPALSAGADRELRELVGPLQHRVAMSNVYPSVVGFFSREATFGGCEAEAFFPGGHINFVQNDDFERWDESTDLPLPWWPSSPSLRVEADHREHRRGSTSARFVVGSDAIVLSQVTAFPRQPEPYRLTVEIWVKTSAARRVRAFIGGKSRMFSRDHPGDGTWQPLVVETTMPASVIAPPRVRLGIEIAAGADTLVHVDAARLRVDSLREAPGGAPRSAQESSPPAIDPSKCHAAWIRGYPRSVSITPTHFVLFRTHLTGFTMCREAECLDKFEDHLRSRYPVVLENRIGTVFRLQGPNPSR